MKRKGFKSFVLKVCESKGVTDAFLRKYVNLKGLEGISVSFELFESFWPSIGGLSGGLKASLPSGALSDPSGNPQQQVVATGVRGKPGDYYKSTYTTIGNDCQGLI